MLKRLSNMPPFFKIARKKDEKGSFFSFTVETVRKCGIVRYWSFPYTFIPQ